MVNYYHAPLDFTFAALADPTRRAIVQRLAAGSATVKELAKPFHVSLPAISKHLRILEQAGFLLRKKEGRVHHCRLNTVPLQQVQDWFAFHQQFWEQRLDALGNYLSQLPDSSQEKERPSWATPQKPAKPHSKSGRPIRPAAKQSSKRGRIPKL